MPADHLDTADGMGRLLEVGEEDSIRDEARRRLLGIIPISREFEAFDGFQRSNPGEGGRIVKGTFQYCIDYSTRCLNFTESG